MMPWPKNHKERSRYRILESAMLLFSSRGFNKVSIEEVMASSDLTPGCFYSHFKSKQELYAEAFKFAANKSAVDKLSKITEKDDHILKKVLDRYLDFKHVKQEITPCPLTFLVTDVANEEDEVRKAYTQSYKRFVTFIKKDLSKGVVSRNEKALALSAMMIGCVAVARALDDTETSKSLLKACKLFGEELIKSVNG
jgi:TetR/AcrR family transcriptional repressor of nem operon